MTEELLTEFVRLPPAVCGVLLPLPGGGQRLLINSAAAFGRQLETYVRAKQSLTPGPAQGTAATCAAGHGAPAQRPASAPLRAGESPGEALARVRAATLTGLQW